jgi:hypothetical protein
MEMIPLAMVGSVCLLGCVTLTGGGDFLGSSNHGRLVLNCRDDANSTALAPVST